MGRGMDKLKSIHQIIRDARQVDIKEWMPDDEREETEKIMRMEHLQKLTWKQLYKLEEMLETEIQILERWGC
jgi:hypothetical protein